MLHDYTLFGILIQGLWDSSKSGFTSQIMHDPRRFYESGISVVGFQISFFRLFENS